MRPRIAYAPVILAVQARLDPAFRNEVCIVVAGPESHSSCWVHSELRTPLVTTMFAIGAPGDYVVQMRAANQVSNAVDVIIQE